MTAMNTPYVLNGIAVRNRFVFPPVVCFGYSDAQGMVSGKNIRHYEERSREGAGIVIVEATAVSPAGRLAPMQLGIWSEEHIPGLAQLASAIRGNGALALIQIHHAGKVVPESVSPVAAGPSAEPENPRIRELTVDEIRAIREDFIAGAVRAKTAGFQGIELHGAHGYLLNQFASSVFNRRTDEYGGSFSGRMRLAAEIIKGIRKACGAGFVIGYRLGSNAPLLSDGIEIARYLETLGVDLIHASHGGYLKDLPRPPADFPYNWIVYCGTEIKKNVNIPVIVVNEIKTAERAEYLVNNGLADFVALARPQLADPFFVRNVTNGKPVNPCLDCKPRCKWYSDGSLCPGIIVLCRAGEYTL
jgi:2,4-dienoyl-CoA reductase-like NADH-dependent reductase (Old Yellow Enzyme family)